jgi:hypothetical protein
MSLTTRAGSEAGSASESAGQRFGSEDPDPHPDPYQNVTDLEHCSNIAEFGIGSTQYN